MVTITETAAKKIKFLLAEEGKTLDYGLRLGVKSGGCSGLSYLMDFDTQKEGDQVFENDGAKVIVDPKSFLYVNGTVLDYVDGLHGAGFALTNPNVKGSCGCGSSFTV